MSGGIDSTAIAATAAELDRFGTRRVSVRAFTTVYDNVVPSDERYYATITARHIGIPITYQRVDGYELFQAPEGPVRCPAEPQNTPYYALWMDLFHLAAQFSPVALHGNGGDEILDQREGQICATLRRGDLSGAASGYLRSLFTHGCLPRTGLWDRVKAKLGRDARWYPKYPDWLEPDFEKRLGLRDRWRAVEETPGPKHPRHTWAYQLLQDPIWPASFESFHPGATGCRLDVRHPLLDIRLARFCLSLPARPWMEDKGLLRAAMRGRLPGCVRRRPKTPLAVSPEEVHLQKGGVLPAGMHPETRRFVKQRVLEKSVRTGNIDPLMDLRPLALSDFLRDLTGVAVRAKAGERLVA
jgi:asparagine synthase (glutamine-hydrolysing)